MEHEYMVYLLCNLRFLLERCLFRDVIEEAKILLESYPRDLLPDWVEIVAKGNPNDMNELRDVALEDIREGARNGNKC